MYNTIQEVEQEQFSLMEKKKKIIPNEGPKHSKRQSVGDPKEIYTT